MGWEHAAVTARKIRIIFMDMCNASALLLDRACLGHVGMGALDGRGQSLYVNSQMAQIAIELVNPRGQGVGRTGSFATQAQTGVVRDASRASQLRLGLELLEFVFGDSKADHSGPAPETHR